jgi:hypothetical protein
MGPEVVQRPYFRIATTAPDVVVRGGHGPYGGPGPDGVGGHAGDHGADGRTRRRARAGTQRRRRPASQVGDVADSGEKRRLGQRSTSPGKGGRDRPTQRTRWQRRPRRGWRLGEHAADDERLTADAVRPMSRPGHFVVPTDDQEREWRSVRRYENSRHFRAPCTRPLMPASERCQSRIQTRAQGSLAVRTARPDISPVVNHVDMAPVKVPAKPCSPIPTG